MDFLDLITFFINFIKYTKLLYFVFFVYFVHFLQEKNKIRILKKVLCFKTYPPKCFVSIPKFKSKILDRKRDVVILDEIHLMYNISFLLNKIGVTILFNNEKNVLYDEIHIGGPVSNEYVNHYFNLYLKNIKWIVTNEHLNKYKRDENLKKLNYEFIEVSDEGNEGFLIDGTFYPYSKGGRGWGILIKITIDKNNSEIEPKTIHLIFGCGTNGTIGAADYFVNHYTKIYKKNKKGKYFGIFQVDSDGKKIGKLIWLDIDKFLTI